MELSGDIRLAVKATGKQCTKKRKLEITVKLVWKMLEEKGVPKLWDILLEEKGLNF